MLVNCALLTVASGCLPTDSEPDDTAKPAGSTADTRATSDTAMPGGPTIHSASRLQHPTFPRLHIGLARVGGIDGDAASAVEFVQGGEVWVDETVGVSALGESDEDYDAVSASVAPWVEITVEDAAGNETITTAGWSKSWKLNGFDGKSNHVPRPMGWAIDLFGSDVMARSLSITSATLHGDGSRVRASWTDNVELVLAGKHISDQPELIVRKSGGDAASAVELDVIAPAVHARATVTGDVAIVELQNVAEVLGEEPRSIVYVENGEPVAAASGLATGKRQHRAFSATAATSGPVEVSFELVTAAGPLTLPVTLEPAALDPLTPPPVWLGPSDPIDVDADGTTDLTLGSWAWRGELLVLTEVDGPVTVQSMTIPSTGTTVEPSSERVRLTFEVDVSDAADASLWWFDLDLSSSEVERVSASVEQAPT